MNWKVNDMREYTNKLLDMIEDGLIDSKSVVLMCLSYMSEDEVQDMMVDNDLVYDYEYEEIE